MPEFKLTPRPLTPELADSIYAALNKEAVRKATYRRYILRGAVIGAIIGATAALVGW